MGEKNVVISRRAVYGLVSAAALGAGIAAGVVSGFLMRGGMLPAYAHGVGLVIAALMMYPAIRGLAEMRNVTTAPFQRWLVVWTIAAIICAVVIYPLVVHVLDRLF